MKGHKKLNEKRNDLMNKILLVTTLAATLLSGCARHLLVVDGQPSDPSPRSIDKNDSFAMQLMISGFDKTPNGLKDVEIDESAVDSDAVSYSVMTGLGLLSNGGLGALTGFGWATLLNSGTSYDSSYMYYIAYVPADNIDISETEKIEQYVRDNYIAPAMDAYMASDASKNIELPAQIISNVNNVYTLRGSQCLPKQPKTQDRYYNCGDPFEKVIANRYATIEKGMPFNPSIKANRYIVVRVVDTAMSSLGVAKNLQTDMMYAFIPKLNAYKAELVNEVIPNTIINNPYILGKDNAIYPFITIRK